jgi:hypothetical protein
MQNLFFRSVSFDSLAPARLAPAGPTFGRSTSRLPGRTVLSAQTLNGEKVDFQQNGKTLTITVPQASPVSIVELTFDQSVDGIPANSDGAAH